MTTDDEGKMSLLRHAAAEAGVVPDTVGVKLPRDWREVVPVMEGLIGEKSKSVSGR